jgi:hypothetical protein
MSNREVVEEVSKGYRLTPPNNCPEVIRSLMKDCWKEDPEDRPSFGEIFRVIGIIAKKNVRTTMFEFNQTNSGPEERESVELETKKSEPSVYDASPM